MSDPFVQERARLVGPLWERGYWPQYASTDEALDLLDKPTFLQALQDFQVLTDEAPSEANIERRFCALPDRAPLRRGVCKWPMKLVTWHAYGNVGRIGESDFRTAAKEACEPWNITSGIQLTYSPNPKTANIVMHGVRLDGPGGTLADSQMPCGARPDTQLEQRYDHSDSFAVTLTPQRGQVSLIGTVRHEVGHAIGLEHGGSGLMRPTLSSVLTLGEWENGQTISRYGLPVPIVPPTPPIVPDLPTGTDRWLVSFTDGRIALTVNEKPCRITVLQ